MSSVLVTVRIVLVILLLLIGGGGYWALSRMQMQPDLKEPQELVISADGIRVEPTTERVVIRGFGTARATQRAVLRAEVGGKVVSMNPKIDNGNLVQAGAELLRIDPDVYQTSVDQARAAVDSAKAQLEELQRREENDTRRLEVVRRSRDLANREFERIRKLVQEENVESQSRLDQVESSLVQQEDSVVAIQNALRLYPSQIQSARAQLDNARAALAQAELSLAKTTIVAPFAGRIENKHVELGETVGVMNELLTVIDDRVLEIEVPIEGGEVARWLDLEADIDLKHWFGKLPDVDVTVQWTEQSSQIHWTGKLDRIQRYDESNRTVVLVVRVVGAVNSLDAAPAGSGMQAGGFPLLEGMFCRVEIPGKILENVFSLPRPSVGHDGTVYTATDGRLRTRKVEVLRLEENRAIVREGLQPGDVVLVTRPGIVLDGVKVEINLQNPEATDYWRANDGEANGASLVDSAGSTDHLADAEAVESAEDAKRMGDDRLFSGDGQARRPEFQQP